MLEEEPLPPDTGSRSRKGIYYGYIIVLCSFLITTITYGVNYCFGVFFNPISAEFGWNKTETSIAYSISMVFPGFLGILIGRISDSFGPRVTTLLCGVFLASGCFLMSRVNALWQFYLFFGVMMGIGFSGMFAPLVAAVSRWFILRRGAMTSIVAAGIGVGTMVVPQIAYRLLASFGWRISFEYLSLLVVVLIIPSALFLKRDPASIGQLPYGSTREIKENKPAGVRNFSFRESMRTTRFWIVCAIYFSLGYGVQAVMVHVVPYATSLGITPTSAAAIITVVGLGGIIGRLAMGSMCDRIGIRYSLLLSLCIWLLAFLWLQFSIDAWRLYLFGFAFGFAYGAMIGLAVLVGADMFGLVSLGTIVAVLMFMYTEGGAVGPAVTGYLADITRNYHLAFVICLVLAFTGLLLFLLLKRKDWKGAG